MDIERKKLYLARDHFGVKPVYYSSSNDSFIFSSEIRPVKYLMNKTEFEKDNLPTLLRLRYLPSPLTLNKDIKKLKPGHYVTVDLSSKLLQYKENCYIGEKISKVQKLANSNKAEDYEYYIENAVKRQLMGDVEVGVLLSGGVDSAIVAVLAQKHLYWVRPSFYYWF